MKMCFGFLDDQAAVARLLVLGKRAEHNRHEDEVVEAQPVLLDLE